MIPTESVSNLTEVILSWYVPFFAMIYIVRDKDDIVVILKIICACALFNTAAGIVEFFTHRNIFVEMFPSGMLQALIANNPLLSALLPGPGHFRNGLYRANSSFVTPLSFGEFQIIVIPIGLFFALHREKLFERTLGWVVVFSGIIGIFCSGSRGGWVGVIASVAVFVVIWSIRKAMRSKASLAPATVGLAGLIFFAVVIVLINVWQRAHNMVLGGAAQAGSTDARYEQWVAGAQFIKSNPITGHGLAMSGNLIQSSVDSYPLSLVLETGIPGLVFFTGLVLLPIWYGVRSYLSDMSETGAMAGALACSFIAYAENRLVLSQRENHMLIFSLLAIVIVLNYEHARKQVPQRLNHKSLAEPHYRAGSVSPGSG